MVQGGDLTANSATTTEAMTNAVLIIVRPQKVYADARFVCRGLPWPAAGN